MSPPKRGCGSRVRGRTEKPQGRADAWTGSQHLTPEPNSPQGLRLHGLVHISHPLALIVERLEAAHG
jgi:hypothetical protein